MATVSCTSGSTVSCALSHQTGCCGLLHHTAAPVGEQENELSKSGWFLRATIVVGKHVLWIAPTYSESLRPVIQ